MEETIYKTCGMEVEYAALVKYADATLTKYWLLIYIWCIPSGMYVLNKLKLPCNKYTCCSSDICQFVLLLACKHVGVRVWEPFESTLLEQGISKRLNIC